MPLDDDATAVTATAVAEVAETATFAVDDEMAPPAAADDADVTLAFPVGVPLVFEDVAPPAPPVEALPSTTTLPPQPIATAAEAASAKTSNLIQRG